MNLSAAAATTLLTLVAVSLAALYLKQRAENVRLRADIDRLRGEAAQNQVALRQRTELDSVKDEFISTVSHELRTPLTSIRGALGLLSAGLMGKVDDRAANLLRIASSNTDRLVRLINDILDLERMSSGTAPLQLRPCSVRDLILLSVDTMSAMAANARVKLDFVPEPGNPSLVCDVDPDRLQQVLTNLLSNAIKFSAPDSTIRVITDARPQELTIRVEDHGRGVPAEKLESIFERFHQVDPADSRQKGGTGLGLAICRSIVSQHGGQIWAERNDKRVPGEPGSTFCVRLNRIEVPQPGAVPASRAQGTVLIVDEDPGVRQLMGDCVRQHGCAAIETDSGQSAAQIAGRENPEAILLGLSVAGPAAWDVVERLKEDPLTAAIPLVLLRVDSTGPRGGMQAPLIANQPGRRNQLANPGPSLGQLARVLRGGPAAARILVVEDDQDLASVILSSFERSRQERSTEETTLQLEHVSSLEAAVEACRNCPPDLLLLDVNLPNGSGFALVKWMRGQPQLASLPLVVYSAAGFAPEEIHQLRPGSTQLLTKTGLQPKEVEDLVLALVGDAQKLSKEGLSA